MKKKAWWCSACKKLVTEFHIGFPVVQKYCKKCGSLLILETKEVKI